MSRHELWEAMLQENHENEYVDAEDANEEYPSAQHEDYDWELAQDEILECQEREDFAGDDWDHGQYDQYDEY